MVFPALGNSGHLVVSISIDFPSNSKGNAPYHCVNDDYSLVDSDSLCDH